MDRYQLEHLADHLHAAGRIRELYRLITRDWMAFKRARLGSHRSLAHDVELAVHSGEPTRAVELPPLFKHCLLSVTLNALTANVPPEVLQAMAAAGEVEQALAYVDLIPDPFRQAHAFLSVAAVLVDQGQIAAAGPLWSQAQALTAGLDRQVERAAVVSALAHQVARAGRQEQARRFVRQAQELKGTISSSEDWPKAVNGLADLAAAQAGLGDDESARQTLSQAFSRLVQGYNFYRAHDWMESLGNVVAAMAEAGDEAGLRRVKSALSRRGLGATATIGGGDGLGLYGRTPFALAVAARALAEAGKPEQARWALAEAHQASRFRGGPARYAAEAAAEIALVTATIGRSTTAARPAPPSPSFRGKDQKDWRRMVGPSLFGPTQTVQQALAEADAALRRMAQEEAERAQASSSSGSGGSRLKGGIEGLARLASRAHVPGALLAAEHLRDEASFEEHYERNERMDNQLARAACLAKMAAARALAGEREQARRLLVRALAVSEALEDEQRQEMALRQIALAMRRAGGVPGLASDVARAAERFRLEPRRADLYASLAVALAQAGRPEAASQAVADALLAARGTATEEFAMSLAPRLVPVGHRQGLRRLVAEVEKEMDREERATAYAVLAGSLARAGEEELARELVRYVQGTLLSLESVPEIPLRLALVADAQAELGQPRRCRRSIRRALGAIETLSGKGLVGGLLKRALGYEEEGEDGEGEGEEAMWELATLLLIRPVVRVGDEATFARLLEATGAIRDVGERTDVLQGIVMYVAEGGAEGLMPWGQLEELLDELAWLVPAPGELEPTPAMREMTRRALREAVDGSEALSPERRADALARLGLAQGALGDRTGLGGTLATIAGMEPGEERSRALGTLSPALARLGDRQGVEHACAAIEAVGDPQVRAELQVLGVDALKILAVAALEAGDGAQAARLVERALELADGEAGSRELVGALADMAGELLGTPAQEPGRWLLDAADRLADALQELEPGALAVAARVHALVGDRPTACRLLSAGAVLARTVVVGDTLLGARTREPMFEYLELAIPALVALDGTGGLLENAWQGVHEIDAWWAGGSAEEAGLAGPGIPSEVQ